MSHYAKKQRFERGGKPPLQTHIFAHDTGRCLVCRRWKHECHTVKCLKPKKNAK